MTSRVSHSGKHHGGKGVKAGQGEVRPKQIKEGSEQIEPGQIKLELDTRSLARSDQIGPAGNHHPSAINHL